MPPCPPCTETCPYCPLLAPPGGWHAALGVPDALSAERPAVPPLFTEQDCLAVVARCRFARLCGCAAGGLRCVGGTFDGCSALPPDFCSACLSLFPEPT